VRILATHDDELRAAMERYQQTLSDTVKAKDANVRDKYAGEA
jgi:hypothetical protein